MTDRQYLVGPVLDWFEANGLVPVPCRPGSKAPIGAISGRGLYGGSPPAPAALLTAAAVAEYLQVTEETLAVWRHRRQGPPHVKVGRCVRYRREALEAYLRENERGGDAR